MKIVPFIIAAATLGAAAYFVLNQQSPEFATGNDAADDAAAGASNWGSKQRLTGTGGSLLGKAKEGIGNVTGNDKLAGEGVVDQAVGTVKDTAGKAANAVGDTIRDLKR